MAYLPEERETVIRDVSPFAKPKRKISAEQKRALSERAKMRFKV